METKKVKLTQVALNEANPRTITEPKMQKLVDSILVFPRMLELRPIVIDETFTALGGNMRLKALTIISGMSADQIRERLAGQSVFSKKAQGEQEAIVAYWQKWLTRPQAVVVQEQSLTEDEKKQFIIKDNVSFGQWDWVALGKWDTADLGAWGMDVWTPPPTDWSNGAKQGNDFSGGALPPELQGVDISPDDLPKLQGDDDTEYQRVIITYRKEQEQEVCNLLGVEKIDRVVYELNEIVNGAV